LPISKFSGCIFDFLPLNLLLVRSHQAEIIILSKDATTCAMREGIELRSRDCDHTVAVKNGTLTLLATLPTN